jgi:acyl-CoA thioester hydrolase
VKHVTTYRVIYGDTDQMGVAYYANYLRWFEIGRTEFMREAGIPYEQAEREGIFFPVTEVQCRYRKPALYDNLLRIETTVESLSRVAVKFHYWIGLEENRVTLASGWTKHACLDRNRKVTRLPGAYARGLGLNPG